jgi:hypothetical protein
MQPLRKNNLPDDDFIMLKHVVEVIFIKEWQRSTPAAYEHDKMLHLQGYPSKLYH